MLSRRAVCKISRDKLFRVGLVLLLLLIVPAAWYRATSPRKPWDFAGRPLEPPSTKHFLGTDDLGRDVATMMSHGLFTTISIGLTASALVLLVGVTAGVLGGMLRGIVEVVLMRLADFLLSLPSLVIAIVLVAVLGPSKFNIILVLAIVDWPSIARLTRAYTLSIMESPFVEAAKAVGANLTHLVSRHVIPSLLPVILAGMVLSIRAAVLLESGLSFLGLGDPSDISLGTLLLYARRSVALVAGAYWLTVFPGLAFMLLVLAFTLISLLIERNLRIKEEN